jgi:hypothetical protein
VLVLVLGEERHGVARRAGAARAADTVHVVFAPAKQPDADTGNRRHWANQSTTCGSLACIRR